MIISHGRKYIFVHIPKTGGTALSQALEARAMKDDILIGDTEKARRRRKRQQNLQGSGRLWKHARLTDIYGVVSQADIESYFIATLVRNPWDWLVSYYHWLRVQPWDHQIVRLSRVLEFGDFLQSPFLQTSIQNSSYASYVTDQQGVLRCSQFIRLEHLKADLACFEAHLGFSMDDFPTINQSSRQKDYRGYYDDTTAQLVSGLCADDINRFDYRFD